MKFPTELIMNTISGNSSRWMCSASAALSGVPLRISSYMRTCGSNKSGAGIMPNGASAQGVWKLDAGKATEDIEGAVGFVEQLSHIGSRTFAF